MKIITLLNKKIDIKWLTVIFAVFFLFYLFNLTILPIFCDEAIYIRWAQIIKNEPTLRFIPLTDGKQPLFMWLNAITFSFFSNPLFAGRFVSVFAGLFNLLGTAMLAEKLFPEYKKNIFNLTVFLFILSPFMFFFSRMALADSLLSAFLTWSVLMAVIYLNTDKIIYSLLSGILLGLAWLTKSPALLYAVLIPSSLALLYILKNVGKLKEFLRSKKTLIKLFGLFLIPFLAFLIYNLLRIDQSFHMIGLRNKDYIFSFSEILKHPFNPLIGHLKDSWRYYSGYLTFPVFFLGLFGFFSSLVKKNNRLNSLLLLIFWFVPLIAQSSVAKVFTARYILFTVPFFLIYSAVGLSTIFEKFRLNNKAKLAVLFLLAILPLNFIRLLLFSPEKAPLPLDEKKGYLEDWTAGQGIKEIADYITEKSKENKVIVSTEGFFGTLPNGLQIYVEGNDNISVIGYTVPVREIPESLNKAKKAGDTTYLVVNKSRMEIKNKEGLRLIEEYHKPGNDSLLFYEYNP